MKNCRYLFFIIPNRVAWFGRILETPCARSAGQIDRQTNITTVLYVGKLGETLGETRSVPTLPRLCLRPR